VHAEDITYLEVPRVGTVHGADPVTPPVGTAGGGAYWFGHRAYDDAKSGVHEPAGYGLGTVIEQPWVGQLDGRPVYGVAIADRSEVRGVRVALADPARERGAGQGYRGPWVEVVEGQPVPLHAGQRPRIMLDRLDWTDGRLVLAIARTPEAVAALPIGVRPDASLVASQETWSADVAVYLQVRQALSRLRLLARGYNHDQATAANVTVTALAVDLRGPTPADAQLVPNVDNAAAATAAAVLSKWAHSDTQAFGNALSLSADAAVELSLHLAGRAE